MMKLPARVGVGDAFGVGVYCGAREGVDARYLASAHEVGRAIAGRGLRVVYGGGGLGLMGRLASGALQAGGEVTGVIPAEMVGKERAHPGVGDMRVVGTMHERKALITALSDGFLALPGGVGTLDELFEAMTWRQLGVHDCRIALLNVDGFFDELWVFLRGLVVGGFVAEETLGAIGCVAEIDGVLDWLVGV